MPHTETYIDGIWFPSVTTVLAQSKPWLEAWKERWGTRAERKLKIASQIGIEFHKCVDQYLSSGRFEVSDGSDGFPTSCMIRIIGMMGSFINWATNIEGEVHATELKVISRLYTYSGTLDAVGTFNDKPIIYDWKTSSRIYDDMDLQLVAYAQAYKEETGENIGRGLIVQVSKKKPDFKLTTRVFKLGKRPLNKFLTLRRKFVGNPP